jgi:peptide/nickel transport system substrate-binding protein
VLLVSLLPGISSAQDETILVIGHAESTDSLDPARGYTQTTGIVNRVLYNTLVTFPDTDASSIQPMLAEDWDISDDGLVYTFTLRDDVVFSNGDALTAADVVFSINRLKNVKGNPSFLADPIASVEATDDQTVVFTLVAVRPSFLSELTNNAFSITNADEVMANGGTDAADAAESDTAEAYLNSASAGTGPYILDHWEALTETVLVRNPNYWGDAPYFDRIIIRNVAEPATQQELLEAGDIDMALDLSADQVSGLDGNADIAIFSTPGVITHFLLMNQDPELGGPVSDPNVQLAIRLALDYEGYKTLWGGIVPASNLTYGLQTAFGEDRALPRDLEQARTLLAEAGYPDGFEITLQYPDFSFQGVNMNTNAQKIQADLAEVGIDVTLEPGELSVELEEYRNGDQGFAYWFWGPDILDPLDVLSFLPKTADGVGGKVATERANWTEEIADPALIELRNRAQTESGLAGRAEVFGLIQEALQQNSPWAPFNVPAVQTAYRSDIEGYVYHPQWLLDMSLLSRAE